ncbi:hypothetical protein Tco_0488538 [Tanacetum coccineum]
MISMMLRLAFPPWRGVTLDCSMVKLSATPRKPTTSRRKSCTSSLTLSILCDIVQGWGAGGGGGGTCAGASVGTGIS